MMNTRQLRTALTANLSTRTQFGGVCSADMIPNIVRRRPKLYIVNTDTSYYSGKHWVAFYFPTNGPPEFFDPLGHSPDYYHRRFRNVLLINGPQYIYNCRRLQGPESVYCGQFCLYYGYRRCRGMSMRTIVNEFSSTNFALNDEIVL